MRIKILNTAFLLTVFSCVGMSFMSSQPLPRTPLIIKPALPVPVADTLPVPAVLERIGEKTEELKEKTRVIGVNSRANERNVDKLEKLVDRIPNVDEDGDYHDSTFRYPIDTPSKPGFFRRFGSGFLDWFKRK